LPRPKESTSMMWQMSHGKMLRRCTGSRSRGFATFSSSHKAVDKSPRPPEQGLRAVEQCVSQGSEIVAGPG
jgi:hypothetical protein